jgi:hypothetical protein
MTFTARSNPTALSGRVFSKDENHDISDTADNGS